MNNKSESELDDFIQFHHNPIVAQKNEEIAHLQKLCEEQRGELARWQAMCEKSVGCSMLADEFADEPHDPEIFGDYVMNLRGQIMDLEQTVSEFQKRAVDPIKVFDEKYQQLESQLATQTERIRVLEKELASMIGSHGEPCADLHGGLGDCSAVKSAKQALNQESLGDGGKGE